MQKPPLWRTLITVLTGVLLFGVLLGVLRMFPDAVPPEWNPWVPLSLEDPPTAITRYKLSRLESDPDACMHFLESTAASFEPVADRTLDDGCGWQHGVMLKRLPLEVNQAFILNCPTAASLLMWERHALQPAAIRVYGERVTALTHAGTYACRNVYNREKAARSEHATANAIDVTGFRLESGRRVTLLRGWADEDDLAAEFLHEAHDGACDFFSGVLGPEYNAAHRDHLHLDRGPYRICQ